VPSAHILAEAQVRDASDRDYRVLVLADATADPQPDVHEFLTERIFPGRPT
jgi:nicotinamidase-related amidase